jgi:hypothetical protein
LYVKRVRGNIRCLLFDGLKGVYGRDDIVNNLTVLVTFCMWKRQEDIAGEAGRKDVRCCFMEGVIVVFQGGCEPLGCMSVASVRRASAAGGLGRDGDVEGLVVVCRHRDNVAFQGVIEVPSEYNVDAGAFSGS